MFNIFKSKPKRVSDGKMLVEIAEIRIKDWKANPLLTDSNTPYDSRYYGVQTKTLFLDNLKLRTVPESLRSAHNIEVLILRSNELQELPDWFSELSSLKIIDLSENYFTRIPDVIVLLKELKWLLIEKNSLTKLTKDLLTLPLRQLSIKENPDLGIPSSILDKQQNGANEILKYYFNSLDGVPLLELKLLVVGRGKSGKTTLIKRLTDEEPDINESETHSISIRELLLLCSKGQVRTRIWDFGGQEILHSTHQFFLTERSLYLLVLEPRTGLAQRDAEYWLRLVEIQGNGSPVIVIMNWSHDKKWRLDEVKLRRKFTFIVNFIHVDAWLNEGISELNKLIIKTVEQNMPDVWYNFPRRWREIKDSVAGMKENYLTYSQYCNLCKKFGEYDILDQAELAEYLHTLGLALYFGNDSRLHDTRVLNPSWVTGGVYAVIRSSLVAQNDGQLVVSDMPQILHEAEMKNLINILDYPIETHRFILELMNAFQLCYASEEPKNKFGNAYRGAKQVHYLVPELLPEFEPDMEDKWEESPLRLRYRYDLLPPGLLPRFIVRTHELSDESLHWRHGVVLRHSDAKVLIRAEADINELHVFILGGDYDVRRTLATIVRRELESLHAKMKMQPVEELELSGEENQWISVKALREVEQAGEDSQKLLPVQPEGTAQVNVPYELDKLIPQEAREIDRDPTKEIPVHIFVSYAHDDERQLKRLDSILDVLEQQHGIASWRDKRLIAGEEWDEEIRNRLEYMDIFLFIASQTSLIRPYIKDPELRRANDRRNAGEIEMAVVKLEPCACDEDASLKKLQRLATKFKSIAEAPLKSAAWEQVRKDLLIVIQKVRQKKKESHPE